ncbi:MAG: hypothetical protein U0800_20975 [Isosphaeraceae bacterium]
MKPLTRRNWISSTGAALPILWQGRSPASAPELPPQAIRLRPFEESVRAAFGEAPERGSCRRIEVGDSDLVRAGVQGCHNTTAFAGFPPGQLTIVRSSAGPGPPRGGLRLYVTAVEVRWNPEHVPERSTRGLDFARIPPAPFFD